MQEKTAQTKNMSFQALILFYIGSLSFVLGAFTFPCTWIGMEFGVIDRTHSFFGSWLYLWCNALGAAFVFCVWFTHSIRNTNRD